MTNSQLSKIASNYEILEYLFDFIKSGIMVLEPIDDFEDYLLKDINKAVETIERLNRTDIIGKKLTDIFPNIKNIGLFEILRSVQISSKAEDFILNIHQNGKLSGWRENHIFKLSTNEIVIIYDDHSVKQGVVSNLSKSDFSHNLIFSFDKNEIKFQHLLDEIPIGISIMAQNGNIRYSNSTIETMFGYSKNDISTIDNWWNYAYPDADYRQWVINTWENSINNALKNNGVIKPNEYQITCKNGEKKYIEVAGIIFDDEVLVTMFDLTDRKQHQIELEYAKQTADSANRAKSMFLANMSHEIRTPMNAILGLTSLILDTKLEPKQKDYLEKIKYSSTSLLQILNDILDYSKIEAHKLEIVESDFAISDVIQNISNLYLPQIEQKGLTLDIHFSNSVPQAIRGDELRLTQVLSNLISNAIKFTTKGAIGVYIHCKTSLNDKNKLYFDVKDSGIGMSKEDLKRLFKPFTQADDTITRKYGGTGLGLSISKELVELMGGQISVESEFEKGSIFSFFIEVAIVSSIAQNKEKQKNILIPIEKNSALKGKQILVVEDNFLNQEVAKGLLEKFGAIVSLACDGRLALDLIEANNFDVVLMDVHMPHMDGLEATQIIRRLPNSKANIPIFAMTAAVAKADIDECISAGMDDFIKKPINIDEIVYKINTFKRGNEIHEEHLFIPILMEHFDIDKETALKYLNLFIKSSEHFEDDLTTEVIKKDFNLAIGLIHKMKNSIGNIEQGELYSFANNIEKELKNGILNEADIKKFIREIVSIKSQIIKEIEANVKL